MDRFGDPGPASSFGKNLNCQGASPNSIELVYLTITTTHLPYQVRQKALVASSRRSMVRSLRAAVTSHSPPWAR